ncbi:MAG TPA: ABC transporter permease [Anaerolineales bacterium]|nr:ABC transporter permease [Anaerolineales bacterium]
MLQRISNYLYLHPKTFLSIMLTPPVFWLGVVYLGSLLTLLINSFFYLDDFSGLIVREFSLRSYAQLFTQSNLDIVTRTAGMAAAVTVAAGIIALPISFFIARYAGPRLKPILLLSVLLPLWSSYLVRVYSWKLILAKEGIISWLFSTTGMEGILSAILGLPGIGGPSLSISAIGVFVVFVYVWLPYMILPIQASLERVPQSLLEASSDLGANSRQTFRHVILPLAFPGVVAGSIFTFSLTLGDFIVPSVLGNSSYFIGQAVLSHQGTSGNIPLAAAMTTVPMLIMAVYLLVARKLGAFEAL